ncbi:hypothetical protein D3C81_1342220 [compost metagenome]
MDSAVGLLDGADIADIQDRGDSPALDIAGQAFEGGAGLAHDGVGADRAVVQAFFRVAAVAQAAVAEALGAVGVVRRLPAEAREVEHGGLFAVRNGGAVGDVARRAVGLVDQRRGDERVAETQAALAAHARHVVDLQDAVGPRAVFPRNQLEGPLRVRFLGKRRANEEQGEPARHRHGCTHRDLVGIAQISTADARQAARRRAFTGTCRCAPAGFRLVVFRCPSDGCFLRSADG